MGGFIVALIQDYNVKGPSFSDSRLDVLCQFLPFLLWRTNVRVKSTTFHTREVIPGKACNHP